MFDKAAEVEANPKYASELGWSLVEYQLLRTPVKALRRTVRWFDNWTLQWQTSSTYHYCASDICEVFNIPQVRMSHAITRTDPGKSVEPSQVDYRTKSIYFNGKNYLDEELVHQILKELASRRPYLNTLRVAYAPTTSSLFGRHGVVK